MKINVNSWHYAIWEASYGDRTNLPSSTDLCRYCHRVFWMLMFMLLIVATVLFSGGTILWLVGSLFIKAPLGFICLAGILGAVWFGVRLYQNWLNAKSSPISDTDSLPVVWMKAGKQKVCPLVEFSSEEETEESNSE